LPSATSAKEQKKIDKLSSLSGDQFDRAYAKDMVADHKMDVKEFQMEAQKADDADLRAWAAKTEPTLEMHLQMATNMWTTVSAK
jgi:putative membrane protein